VHEKELEASREVTSLVSVESVARMGVAELEACLAQALNPQGRSRCSKRYSSGFGIRRSRGAGLGPAR
jgi:hypothetical protein